MSLDRLLAQNRAWSARMQCRVPDFFSRLEKQQTPEYLWIGCSDSRVPANQILDLAPGEIFVHRNIANVVASSDLNCLSVLQFAVDVLRVRHIMVVGHYGCGGIRAALEEQRLGLVDHWIRQIRDVRNKHEVVLGCCAPQLRVDRLCELNVAEQFANICSTTVVQDAWRRGQKVIVHGLVYSLSDGLLRELGLSGAEPGSAQTAYATFVREYEAGIRLPASQRGLVRDEGN